MVDIALLNYLETLITEERKKRFMEVLSERTNFLTIVMEDVYQLHNTSAVLRSCDVFGIQNLHVIETRFGDRLDKNIAMGAEKWVDLSRHDNVRNCLADLRSKGYSIVATTPNVDGILIDEFKLEKPTALFFGTEKEGLSKEVLNNADQLIRIPMLGFTESLNISVSVAIILFEMSKKLRASAIEWNCQRKRFWKKDWIGVRSLLKV